jgi:hypothetical protein
VAFGECGRGAKLNMEMTTATDLLLGTLLEVAGLYEAVSRMSSSSLDALQYIKNYPFAEARVRREINKNEAFAGFLMDRNTHELTRRRDVVCCPLDTMQSS